MTHPSAALDDIVHQRTRLGILVVLKQAGEVDFGTLRDQLEVTDGSLSQHLRVLQEASFVEVKKGYEGRRPRTWLKITRSGSRALAHELDILRQIAGEGATAPAARNPKARPSTIRPAPLAPKLA